MHTDMEVWRTEFKTGSGGMRIAASCQFLSLPVANDIIQMKHLFNVAGDSFHEE